MHILLVADGRSPITRRFLAGLQALQHRVTLISTFPCQPPPGAEETFILPAAFGALSGSQAGSSLRRPAASGMRRAVGRFRNLLLAGRYLLGPLTLPYYALRLRRLLERVRPDLVHALRIPFEGMLAYAARPQVPLVVSIWGNDLTLHAHGSASMRSLTLKTLRRANGLLADAARDLRLGRQWEFPANRPALVLPGNGGIDLAEISRLRSQQENPAWDLPADAPWVVNPRGFRPGSVRNDIFFQAIPLVLERNPAAHFVCPAMAGQVEALGWVRRYKLQDKVSLLPYLPQPQLWSLLMHAAASVSLSSHDGTPNSLLEAMACGCLPVAGDLESLREWITPGVNGLLVEPDKAQSLADALLLALENPQLGRQAAEINLNLIRERAEIGLVRAQLQVFYQRVYDGV